MDNLNPKALTAAEELKAAEGMAGKSWAGMRDEDFNPLKNPDMITIERQSDGNFKLRSQKNGKMVELRAGKPEDALVEFLTSG